MPVVALTADPEDLALALHQPNSVPNGFRVATLNVNGLDDLKLNESRVWFQTLCIDILLLTDIRVDSGRANHFRHTIRTTFPSGTQSKFYGIRTTCRASSACVGGQLILSTP